jgi:hypothetical protein
MKKLIFAIIIMFSYLSVSSQNLPDNEKIFAQSADDKIGSYLNANDLYSLTDDFILLKDSLQSAVVQLLAKALVEEAQNQLDSAAETIIYLTDKYFEDLGVDNYCGMLIKVSKILIELNKHQENIELITNILYDEKKFPFDSIPEYYKSAFEQCLQYSQFFSTFPKMEVQPSKNKSVINYTKYHHLIKTPVEINGKKTQMVFDTGAGGNLVSKSFAKRHNIKILQDSILVRGVTNSDYVQLGLAKSLKIGNVIFNNVLFYIADNLDIRDCKDSSMFVLDAVLSNKIIAELGDISIFPKENKIILKPNINIDNQQNKNILYIDGQFLIMSYNN